MKISQRTCDRIARVLGIGVVLLWTLVLGPIGAMLLGGFTYSMLSNNLTMGVTCALILFSPLLAMLVWAPLMLRASSPREVRDNQVQRAHGLSWLEGKSQ